MTATRLPVGRVAGEREAGPCQSSPRISYLTGGGEGGLGDGDGAEHGLGASEDLAAAGADGDPGQTEGDDAETKACGEGGGGVDALLGDGAVDESDEAEDQGDGAEESENAVAGELGLEDDEHDGGEEESNGGVADGEEIETEEREEDEESSERAGDDGPGDIELEVDQEAAEDEEEDGKVGAGEAGEEALAQGWREGDDGCVVEVEGLGVAVEAADGAVVEGVEESGVVGGYEVDEVELEGFGIAVGLRVADGVFGSLRTLRPRRSE